MSWKEDVEESVWYTEASNRCFPDDLSLYSLRRVENSPVDERKSGTIGRLVDAFDKVGAHPTRTSG